MDYTNIEEKMDKAINMLSEKFAEVRAGRANPAILNKVKVDYYGTPTPINQMAGISVPEARLIVIQPWDLSQIKEIEKAIITSDIGINPNNDGIDEVKAKQKDGDITEDEEKQAENDIQKLTDKKIAEIDKILQEKEKDVMAI